ncbi:MAG: HD domain-containing phosphohydrolase [Leptospirales bacterium]
MLLNSSHKKYAIWVIILAFVLLGFTLLTIRRLSLGQIELSRDTLKKEAISLFDTVVLVRSWAASHKGVYVKQRPGLEPNPYLRNNTLKAANGETLILMNPAFMTRQIFEMKMNVQDDDDHYYKITSLTPLNPVNKPDEFEKRALTYLESRKEKKYYFEFPPEKPNSLYFLGVLKTEESCVSCHPSSKPGDQRGGIRITVPIQDFREKEAFINANSNYVEIAILFITLLVAFITWILFSVIRKGREEVLAVNKNLEQRVKDRTSKIKLLFEKEKYLREIMSTVTKVNKEIITYQSVDSLLSHVCDILAAHSHYSLCWLAIMKGQSNKLNHYHSEDTFNIVARTEVSLDTKSPLSAHPAVRSIREDGIVLINDINREEQMNPWRDLGLESGYQSLCSIPLRSHSHNKPFGALLVYTFRSEPFQPEEVVMLEELAGDLGFAIDAYTRQKDVTRLKAEKIRNFEETILSFVHMIEERDSYTAGHSVRVAGYCALIASAMGVKASDIDKLQKASILHDIGKVATPDSILLRPGKLSKLEYDLIKLHVESGYDVLSKIKMYKELAEIIRYHHEWHNGNGYPSGVRGNEIPPLARILIVADAFDAMTTDRVYHDKLNRDAAIEEIQRNSGSQFHPDVVAAAVKTLANIQVPVIESQFPASELEKKRFSYFFSDRLTELHNEDYFNVLIQDTERMNFYNTIIFISINRFSDYNDKHGWEQGDVLLVQIAGELGSLFPGSLLFRVQGDDFIVITKEIRKSCVEIMGSFQSVNLPGLKATVKYRSIKPGKPLDLDKTALHKMFHS